MQLKDKIALVTGASNGIGTATALELARGGADVAIHYQRDRGAAAKLQDQIEALGRRTTLIAGDMAKPEDAQRCIDATLAALGAIDVLVHSAGGRVPGSIMEVSAEAWYGAFDVHLHAIFHLVRAAVPHMKTRGEGCMIFISSAAGIRGLNGAIAYGTVKGAIIPMVLHLARELADYNIRVNAVAPGIIRTRFHELMTEAQKQHNLDNRIPLHREGTPQQVASMIVALATNDFITGETVRIDGGMTMRIA